MNPTNHVSVPKMFLFKKTAFPQEITKDKVPPLEFQSLWLKQVITGENKINVNEAQ